MAIIKRDKILSEVINTITGQAVKTDVLQPGKWYRVMEFERAGGCAVISLMNYYRDAVPKPVLLYVSTDDYNGGLVYKIAGKGNVINKVRLLYRSGIVYLDFHISQGNCDYYISASNMTRAKLTQIEESVIPDGYKFVEFDLA